MLDRVESWADEYLLMSGEEKFDVLLLFELLLERLCSSNCLVLSFLSFSISSAMPSVIAVSKNMFASIQ